MNKLKTYFQSLTKIEKVIRILSSLYIFVAILSVGHITSTIGIFDNLFFTILNSLALILGISGLIITRYFYKINHPGFKILYFILFVIITGMEFLGNSNHIYTSINSESPFFIGYTELFNIGGSNNDELRQLEVKLLRTPDSLSVQKTSITNSIEFKKQQILKYQKRTLAFVFSVIIVVLGMGFIGFMLYFIEVDKVETKQEENKKKKIIEKARNNFEEELNSKINELTDKFNTDFENQRTKFNEEINKLTSAYKKQSNLLEEEITKLKEVNKNLSEKVQKDLEEENEVFEFLEKNLLDV